MRTYRRLRRKNKFQHVQRHTTQPRGRFSTVPLLFIGVVLTVGILYVFQLNTVATGGLTLRQLGHRLTTLKSDNAELEVQAAQMQSLSIVQQATDRLQLTQQVHYSYLPEIQSTVALVK